MNKPSERDLKELIGYNDRGIVIANICKPSKYSIARCENCGAVIKGTKAIKWQFGHIGCPKPNGEYIKNDLTPKKLKEWHKQHDKALLSKLIEEVEGMKNQPFKEWLKYEIKMMNALRKKGTPEITEKDVERIPVDDIRDKKNRDWNSALNAVLSLFERV